MGRLMPSAESKRTRSPTAFALRRQPPAATRAAQPNASMIFIVRGLKTALLLLFSEVQLQPELDDARVARRSDRAEAHRAEHHVRVAEGRRVRQVEDLCAELKVARLAEIGALNKSKVCVTVAGAAHRVARAVADGELRRDGEGRGVEPARRRLLRRGEIRVGYAIRALRAEPGEGVEVSDLRDGQ